MNYVYAQAFYDIPFPIFAFPKDFGLKKKPLKQHVVSSNSIHSKRDWTIQIKIGGNTVLSFVFFWFSIFSCFQSKREWSLLPSICCLCHC